MGAQTYNTSYLKCVCTVSIISSIVQPLEPLLSRDKFSLYVLHLNFLFCFVAPFDELNILFINFACGCSRSFRIYSHLAIEKTKSKSFRWFCPSNLLVTSPKMDRLSILKWHFKTSLSNLQSIGVNKPLPGRLGRIDVTLLTRGWPGGVVVPPVPRWEGFVVVTPAARGRRLVVPARPSTGRGRVVRVPPGGRPLVPRGRRVVVAVVLGGALPGQLGRTELLAVRAGWPRPRMVRHTRAEINANTLTWD